MNLKKQSAVCVVTVQAESNMEKKIYQHKDKKIGESGYSHDGKYQIVSIEARMKNPTTREWLDCVIYADIDTDVVYVREKQDFFDKFELK